MIYKILAKFRQFIKSFIFLYKFQLKLRNSVFEVSSTSLVNSETEICIEGYPRSANTFIFHLLKILKPSVLVGGHSHTIANIKLALKKKVPVFVLIRNPIDAISSQVLRSNIVKNKSEKKNIEYAIEDYKSFYNYILKNRDKVKLLHFDDVLNNLDNILRIIEMNSTLKFSDLDKNFILEAVQLTYKKIKSFKHLSTYKISSAPDKRRKKYIDQKKKILLKNNFQDLKKLQAIFETLTEKK